VFFFFLFVFPFYFFFFFFCSSQGGEGGMGKERSSLEGTKTQQIFTAGMTSAS
jgi:hypothetical protein